MKEGGGSLIMIYIFKKETIKVTKFKRAWHCSDSHKSWWYFTVHGEKYSYFSLSAFLSIRHHRDLEVRQPKSGEAKKHLWFLVIGVANICFLAWWKPKIPKLSVTKSFPSRPKVDSNELEDQNCQHQNLWNKLLSRQLWIHFPASLRLFTWFVATELRGKPKATFSTDRSSGFPTRTPSLFCAPSDCESRGHFHLGLLRLRPQDFRRLSEVQRPKQ